MAESSECRSTGMLPFSTSKFKYQTSGFFSHCYRLTVASPFFHLLNMVVLAWTVCAYRRPGMSEEDYHTYMSTIHGPLVRDLMAKYGMISFSMVTRFVPTPLSNPPPNAM